MSGTTPPRWTLRNWIAARGAVRRRRLERACRGRLAELDLPRPYDEAAWVEHVEQLVGWPITIVDLTDNLRRRAQATPCEHMYGHTFTMRDGYALAVEPTASADSRALTIAHELAHIVWGDIIPSTDAPTMAAFFRSQGEDIPNVVSFMLSTSGASRRGGRRRLLTKKARRDDAALTQGLAPAEAAAVRARMLAKEESDREQELIEERAEVTATLMARWGTPRPDDGDENAVERFWRA